MRRSILVVAFAVLCLAWFADARSLDSLEHGGVVAAAWRQADGHAYVVDARGRLFATPGFCQPWVEVAQLPNDCYPVAMLDGDVGGSLDIIAIGVWRNSS